MCDGQLKIYWQGSQPGKAEPAERLEQPDSRAGKQQENHQNSIWSQVPEVVHVIMALPQGIDHEECDNHDEQ